jgi:lipoate-protein ligase A
MQWKIINSGRQSALQNMAKDAELLLNLGSEPILHLYDWIQDAITFGGIVFHQADFAFSVLLPSTHSDFSLNPLENYHYIHRKVGALLKKFKGVESHLLAEEKGRESFCMAAPTKYDLMVDGKKVGGAAQRKTKRGYLHQGSLLLGHLPTSYLEEILQDTSIIEKMQKNSSPLLGTSWTRKELVEARDQLKNLFVEL